jgi:hypothetical protein
MSFGGKRRAKKDMLTGRGIFVDPAMPLAIS